MSWLSALGHSCVANSLSVVACFISFHLRTVASKQTPASVPLLFKLCHAPLPGFTLCVAFSPLLLLCLPLCLSAVLRFVVLQCSGFRFPTRTSPTSVREVRVCMCVCVCLLLCPLSLLSLEPWRNGRGETACLTLFISGGVYNPLFKG